MNAGKNSLYFGIGMEHLKSLIKALYSVAEIYPAKNCNEYSDTSRNNAINGCVSGIARGRIVVD